MKTRKEKRSIKSTNDHGLRKKVVSPKLDILRPSNQMNEKKQILGQNKIKNVPRISEQNLARAKFLSDDEIMNPSDQEKGQEMTNFKNRIMKFKEIQRNYLTQLQTENQGHSKLNSSRRSVSWGKLGDSRSMRRLTVYKGDSETVKKDKPMRYEKFAFRSEKYLRLSSEVKTLTSDEYQNTIGKLNEDIDYYKKMYFKSIKALTKIQKIMNNEKNKFQTQRKVYEDQIKKLKLKIQFKKPNLGHLYSYKEFPPEKLIPQTLILERNDENYSDLDIFCFDKEKGEKLLQQYLGMSDEQQLDIENLSIQSK